MVALVTGGLGAALGSIGTALIQSVSKKARLGQWPPIGLLMPQAI